MRRPSPIAHRSTLTPLPPAWETPLARPRHNQHLPPPLQPRNNPATTAHHGSLLAATATEPAAAAVVGAAALCPRAGGTASSIPSLPNTELNLKQYLPTPTPHQRPRADAPSPHTP